MKAKKRPKRRVRVGRSKIHGKGAFATHTLYRGEIFSTDHLGKRWGGFNHSCKPNVILAYELSFELDGAVWTEDGISIPLRKIERGEELTVNYWEFGERPASDRWRCNCSECRLPSGESEAFFHGYDNYSYGSR